MDINQLTNEIKLTSLDIAELTGKRHDNVMRDIRNEVEALGEEIGLLIFEASSYFNSQNKEMPCYKFKKDGAMQLALKYDATTRYKVIKHIEELERTQQQKPLTTREQILLALHAAKETAQRVDVIEEKIDVLHNTMRIDGVQEKWLQDQMKHKVITALGGYKTPAYNELSSKLFRIAWKDFKTHFNIPRYSELPKSYFEEAQQFIRIWQPAASLQLEITALNRQIELEGL